MSNDIPRIDWQAIRDMVRAPAYFARVAETSRASTVDRGLAADELDFKAQPGRLNGTRNPPHRAAKTKGTAWPE